MRRSLRLGFLLLLTLFGALASAQPIIWTHTTPSSSNARLIRDSSGNLYFVTRTGSLTGRQLKLTKYNPLGTVLWAQTLEFAGTLDVQFALQSLALTSTSLLTTVQERDGGGGGNLVRSRLLAYDRSTGSPVFSTDTALELGPIATGNGQFAFLRRDTGTGAMDAVIYDNAFSVLATLTIANPFRMGVIAMDTSNRVFVASYGFQANGETRLTRCSAALGIEGHTMLDAPGYWAEVAFRIVVDPATNRVYALAQGTRDGFADPDTLILVADATTGIQIHAGPVWTSSSGTDMLDDLMVLPGGVAASAGEISSGHVVMRRFDSSGNAVWTRTITNVQAVHERHVALDADGNVLVLTPATSPNIRISRIHAATGDDLGTLEFPVGTNRRPLQIFADAAGNMFVNTNGNGSAHLLRVQPASLTIPATIAVGGSDVNAQINLAGPAATDQTWTIASSNSNVVSVPPNAVVANGSSSATFPLTINGVAANTSVTINVRHNGFITQRAITVIPSMIQSVAITPQVVIGGGSTTAILNLTGTAPAGGQTVNLSSSKPAVASVPATAIVPAGQSSLGVMVTTFAVNSNQGAVITATTGAVSKTAFFAVNAPSLTSISVFPPTMQGGQTGTLTLNINGIAPTGGFSIVLFSGAPGIVFTPAAAPILAGQVTRNVDLPTAPVTSSTNVLIFATRSGIYKTATVTVTP
ncbi:MAG: hypothetical protein IT363_12205 [Methanoregulaceae archaeon]|nr:hypothetical protein [Methanoregulaceae archaeon]